MTTKFVHNNHAQLDTKNLNVYINGAQILKDVNVSIPKGKITCIIGPSGCGKSTLLRTFNRLNDRVEGLKMNGEVNLGNNNFFAKNAVSIWFPDQNTYFKFDRSVQSRCRLAGFTKNLLSLFVSIFLLS